MQHAAKAQQDFSHTAFDAPDSLGVPTQLARPTLLSVLWVFILMNMIYADIIGMLRPGYLELLDSMSKQLTLGMVATFSLLLEVPIAMILLSRVLPRRPNRIANLVAVPISTLFVIYGGIDDPPISYLFFASVEIIAMFYVGYLACTWRPAKGRSPAKVGPA